MKKIVLVFVCVAVFSGMAFAAPVALDSFSPAELESSADVIEMAWFLPPYFKDGRAWIYVRLKNDIVVGSKYAVDDDGLVVPAGEVISSGAGYKYLAIGLEPAGEEPVDMGEVAAPADLFKVGCYITGENAMLLKESIIVRDNVVVRQVGMMGTGIVELWSKQNPESYGTVIPAGTRVQVTFTDLPAVRVSASYEELSSYGELMPVDDVWSIYIPVTQGVDLHDDVYGLANEAHKDGFWRYFVRSLAPKLEYYVAPAEVLENRDQWATTFADLDQIHLEMGNLPRFCVSEDVEAGETLVGLDILATQFRLSPNMRVVEKKDHVRVEDEWLRTDAASIGAVVLALSPVVDEAPAKKESAEKKADNSEPAPTVPQGGSSGGGCNAAGSGLWAFFLLPLLRRRIRF